MPFWRSFVVRAFPSICSYILAFIFIAICIKFNVHKMEISVLFIPKSKFAHTCLKILLKSICTTIIFCIRTVVQTTIGEDSSHICNEQSSSCVVSSFQAVTHCLQICKYEIAHITFRKSNSPTCALI